MGFTNLFIFIGIIVVIFIIELGIYYISSDDEQALFNLMLINALVIALLCYKYILIV